MAPRSYLGDDVVHPSHTPASTQLPRDCRQRSATHHELPRSASKRPRHPPRSPTCTTAMASSTRPEPCSGTMSQIVRRHNDRVGPAHDRSRARDRRDQPPQPNPHRGSTQRSDTGARSQPPVTFVRQPPRAGRTPSTISPSISTRRTSQHLNVEGTYFGHHHRIHLGRTVSAIRADHLDVRLPTVRRRSVGWPSSRREPDGLEPRWFTCDHLAQLARSTGPARISRSHGLPRVAPVCRVRGGSR